MLCPIRLVSLPALKNGQDAPETSPMISWLATRTEPLTTSLLYDVRSQPIGKAAEDGSLVN